MDKFREVPERPKKEETENPAKPVRGMSEKRVRELAAILVGALEHRRLKRAGKKDH